MRWIRLTGILAGIAMFAAACGGPTPTGSDGREKTADDQLVEYTRCMREHGVDIEAESDGDGRISVTIGGPGGAGKDDGGGGDTGAAEGGPDAETEAAMKACEDKLPKGQDLSPEERAQLEDQLLEFARCMREHGIDMPDPGEGGFIQRFDAKGGGSGNGPDPESEEFQAAEKACEDTLPNKGFKSEVSREEAN